LRARLALEGAQLVLVIIYESLHINEQQGSNAAERDHPEMFK